MSDKPLVGDLISARYRGEWLAGYVISVEGRTFIVRFYGDNVPDTSFITTSFQTIDQRGWMLVKTPNTCQG
jgi:hypothetical protein